MKTSSWKRSTKVDSSRGSLWLVQRGQGQEETEGEGLQQRSEREICKEGREGGEETEPVALPPKKRSLCFGRGSLSLGSEPCETPSARQGARPSSYGEGGSLPDVDVTPQWMHTGVHPDKDAPNFAGWRGCLLPRGDPLREARFSV